MEKLYVFLDTETTGLSADKNDVIQIAAIIRRGAQELDRFEFKCQPHRWDSVQQRALDVHGYQLEDLKKFPDPLDTCDRVRSRINAWRINDEKALFCAHNAPFDKRFVEAWFKKCRWADMWDIFETDLICTKKMWTDRAKATGEKLTEDNKLVTIGAYVGVEFDAHDAMGDTIACMAIFDWCAKSDGSLPQPNADLDTPNAYQDPDEETGEEAPVTGDEPVGSLEL